MTQVETEADRLVLRDEFPGMAAEVFFTYWTTPALLCAWWPPEAAIEPRVGRFVYPVVARAGLAAARTLHRI
jgi:hypothetical protein